MLKKILSGAGKLSAKTARSCGRGFGKCWGWFTASHTSSDPDAEPDYVPSYPIAEKLLFLIYAVLVLGSAIYFTELRWWILAASAAHIIASIQTRGADDVGWKFLWGIPTGPPRVGPNLVLFGFMTMMTIREYPKQFQFPDEPEYVFHGDDKLDLPTHPDGTPMVRPMRLVSGGPRKGYEGVLNIQLTTKATGTMRTRIRNFLNFWVRIAGNTPEEKLEELKRQMSDTWFNAVKGEWIKRPIGLVIDEGIEIDELVKKAVDSAARSRGIDAYEITLVTPDLGHQLSAKLSEIGEAAAEAEATRTRADATAYETAKHAEGEAAAHLARERADVDADAYRVEKMGITGEQMFAADTAARVIGDKDKMIFGASGLQEAIAAGAAIIDALTGKPKESQKKDKPDTTTKE